ncbi:MAG: hypothetical protein PVJ98_05510 [Akkermansiaceae bacterium]|jgi:hypothetical protein
MRGRSIDEETPGKRPSFFWWTLANVLAIAFAISSWIVCLNLFRDPTNPTSYRWMLKFGRLDAVTLFPPSEAPDPVKVNDPRSLEARFANLEDSERDSLNRELLRSYLTNFEKAPLLTFVTGEFRVIKTRTLNNSDLFSPGLVVHAQAMVRPDAVADPLPYPVFVNLHLSSESADPNSFPPGKSFTLNRLPHAAALVNLGTIDDNGREVILATITPITSVDFPAPDGSAVPLTAPDPVHPATRLPAKP